MSAETGLDLYAIKNRPSSDVNDNKYLDRFSVGVSVLSKKDFIFNIGKHDLLMTPKVQIVSMHSTNRKNDVPNRDSSDFRIDHANLFLINQYQGRDNLQTNQRLNFGIDNVFDTNIGSFSLFFGQSQKIGGTNKNIINELSEYSSRKENIEVRLTEQEILYGNKSFKFELDPFKKKCLLEGLDDIALSLNKAESIKSFENKMTQDKPWIL